MSVLIELYGLQVAEQMVPISSLDGRDDDPERPVVTGYTSHPACYKSTRQHISFFVNRRWVLSRMLTSAVEEGYHSLLLTGRHPIAVVNIQMDPALLDVNVHPAKTEIRFLRERRVYAAVLRAVRRGLLAEPAMPQWSGNVGAQFIAPSSPNVRTRMMVMPKLMNMKPAITVLILTILITLQSHRSHGIIPGLLSLKRRLAPNRRCSRVSGKAM